MATADIDQPAAGYPAALRRHQAGELAGAADDYRRILRADPGHAAAVHGLGVVAYQTGRPNEAIDHFRQALALDGGFAEAARNLGAVLLDAGRPAEAADAYRRAVDADSAAVAAHLGLGRALAAQDEFDAAAGAYGQAARLDPGSADAHHGLGTALKLLGRLDEAVAALDVAVRLAPDAAVTRLNRATALLQAGDFARGWAEYGWRWRLPGAARRAAGPAWDGGPLAGRTVLLTAEQGVGDTLQFVRYAVTARDRGGRVVLACPGRLLRLLARCPGIDETVDESAPLPPYDLTAPLLDLPALLGLTADAVPAGGPYLAADPGRAAVWRGRLGPAGGLRVGVCWQGNRSHPDDRRRSFPLAALAPLAAVPGVELIALQQGDGAEQAAAAGFPVRSLGAGADGDAGFEDTAAVMTVLDLVVTADTAAAHLAGGLGVPVWLALARVPDWRWGLTGESTPWYPTARLFRQATAGDWGPVFAVMAAELGRRAAGRGMVPITLAAGELFDRITILELKAERLADPRQLAIVGDDLAALTAARDRHLPDWRRESARLAALRVVNTALWDAENDLRACERATDFGPRFVALARSVYQSNDLRARLKRELSELFGSGLCEQKCYAAPDGSGSPGPADASVRPAPGGRA